MLNLAIVLLAGLATFAALFFTHLLRAGEAILPALLVVIITYIFLARRTFKRVEAIFGQAASSLQVMPPRFDHAIATMETAYPLARHQFLVRSQIDTQIGVIYFLQKEFSKALPYLKRSSSFGHWMGAAMLGVIYYKKKDYPQMRSTFEVVIRRGKKSALAWCLYAYLLHQTGDKDGALKILARGAAANKDDPRLNEALLAVQNGKKIKMRVFKEQWYQFHLERPPQDYAQAPMGMKMSRAARRGRW